MRIQLIMCRDNVLFKLPHWLNCLQFFLLKLFQFVSVVFLKLP